MRIILKGRRRGNENHSQNQQTGTNVLLRMILTPLYWPSLCPFTGLRFVPLLALALSLISPTSRTLAHR